MKKLVFLLVVFSYFNIFAQESQKSFNVFNLGLYGGISFYKTSDIGGEFLVETKTNLLSNLLLKLSVGYIQVIEPVNYDIKSWGENSIDGIDYYSYGKRTYSKHNYDVFPVSIGTQYSMNFDLISPYLSLDASYNILSPSLETSHSESFMAESEEDIPEEYLTGELPPSLPTSSLSLSLGAGMLFAISDELRIDARYYYRIDNEIIDTHHIIVGVDFNL